MGHAWTATNSSLWLVSVPFSCFLLCRNALGSRCSTRKSGGRPPILWIPRRGLSPLAEHDRTNKGMDGGERGHSALHVRVVVTPRLTRRIRIREARSPRTGLPLAGPRRATRPLRPDWIVPESGSGCVVHHCTTASLAALRDSPARARYLDDKSSVPSTGLGGDSDTAGR